MRRPRDDSSERMRSHPLGRDASAFRRMRESDVGGVVIPPWAKSPGIHFPVLAFRCEDSLVEDSWRADSTLGRVIEAE
jgi:hypothetical protein